MAAELKGPNPCVTEADEEGWMLVNLPGESHQWECRVGVEGLMLRLGATPNGKTVICIMLKDLGR